MNIPSSCLIFCIMSLSPWSSWLSIHRVVGDFIGMISVFVEEGLTTTFISTSVLAGSSSDSWSDWGMVRFVFWRRSLLNSVEVWKTLFSVWGNARDGSHVLMWVPCLSRGPICSFCFYNSSSTCRISYMCFDVVVTTSTQWDTVSGK